MGPCNMKPKPTISDLVNLWLTKYHNTTIAQVEKAHPEWTHREFYAAYPVTQQQHDDWYNEAIELLHKHFRYSKKFIKKAFQFNYLDCAPSIIHENTT